MNTEWTTTPPPVETEHEEKECGTPTPLDQVIRDRLHWLGLDRSKYTPHQGKQECARRLRQMKGRLKDGNLPREELAGTN